MPPIMHFILYTVAALWLLTWGGNRICRIVFEFTGLTAVTPPDPIEPVKAGRVIGSLERLVIALGIAAGSWEVIAAVIALKTVARFKELDEKRFAEYFLIGSLFSLLWASAITGLWATYDELAGVKARDRLAAIISPSDGEKKEKDGGDSKQLDRPSAGQGSPKVEKPGPVRRKPTTPG